MRTSRRRVLADRGASLVVRAGGLAVLASVLGLLVFLLSEASALLAPAHVEVLRSFPVKAAPGALLVDDHVTHLAALGPDGVVRVLRSGDGSELLQAGLPLEPGERVVAVRALAREKLLAASTDDGRLLLQPLAWRVRYQGSERRVEPELLAQSALRVAPPGTPVAHFALGHSADHTTVAVARPGGVQLTRIETERNDFTGAVTSREESQLLPWLGAIGALALGPEQRHLFAADGQTLLWWDLAASGSNEPISARATVPVTSLSLLLGGRALVSGHEDGSLGIWFPLRRGSAGTELLLVRDFAGAPGAVTEIAASRRDRSFLAAREHGPLGLYYSTSQRVLWQGDPGLGPVDALAFSSRGDAALVASGGRVTVLGIRNPHPEISFRTLFSRVWYEGYPEPAHVWQSSGGTDEFESKLGLMPLLVGTLKGTFYSLLLAVPLAVLAAMYTSQFLHVSLQRVVKPTIELMASLPSVVLGFLAGLWLAPRLEQVFPALLLMAVALPLTAIATGFAWSRIPRRLVVRLPEGCEVFAHAVTLGLVMAVCVGASGAVEAAAFAGDFPRWLGDTTGLVYDQRNAVVVGIAMGFAVIPIVFSISDDAFSSVPRALSAASLALGATRWQTLTRVLLPAASPGLFAAVMIGFGRAVGETMIVLMATGNTPILDWNPFNGFRTLSANIAVEIPEAPHGGTLYRMLFVAALLLFALTFMINTASELVRQRLRARFGRF